LPQGRVLRFRPVLPPNHALSSSLRPRRPVGALLAAIVALAALARFWGLGFGLPHTQARPDESFIIDVARSFLRGDFSPPFYDYPWLYMWMVTGLYLGYYVWGLMVGAFDSVNDLLASWPVHWEPFYLISRSLSATLGTATVLIVYRIGRQLWDEATGLVAAMFLSLASIHARDSHFGTTDIAMTMFITLGVSLLVDAHRTRRYSTYALAGLVAGMAAATKYSALPMVVPFIASQIVHVVESPGARWQAAADGRLAAAAAGFAVAFAIGVPFVVLDTERFLVAMRQLGDSMQTGQPWLELKAGWIHHLQFSLRYGMGLPLLFAGVVGMTLILRTQPLVGLLVFSFPITYYIAAGSIRNLFFRYAIPLVPFLCLAAARVVIGTSAFSPRGRRAIAVGLALGLVFPSAISVWQFNRIISQTDNRVIVARWFADHVPAGSSVLQTGSRYGHVQFDPRLGYKQWIWDGRRRLFLLNGQPAGGRPDWILVQESPLPSETQAIVREFLREDYVFAWPFKALPLGKGLVFDRQDAFFVPFAGFERVTRPGPNFTLFKRVAAAGGPSS
jgi:4-amino-4-deoxy-L-arabinose transferase-like glycosyltransferase